jgi:hypothetical protein
LDSSALPEETGGDSQPLCSFQYCWGKGKMHLDLLGFKMIQGMYFHGFLFLFLLLIYLFPSFLAALLSTFCAVPSPF